MKRERRKAERVWGDENKQRWKSGEVNKVRTW